MVVNRKTKKLKFIRAKNKIKSAGYREPEWICVRKTFPAKWVNVNPEVGYKEDWIIVI